MCVSVSVFVLVLSWLTHLVQWHTGNWGRFFNTRRTKNSNMNHNMQLETNNILLYFQLATNRCDQMSERKRTRDCESKKTCAIYKQNAIHSQNITQNSNLATAVLYMYCAHHANVFAYMCACQSLAFFCSFFFAFSWLIFRCVRTASSW